MAKATSCERVRRSGGAAVVGHRGAMGTRPENTLASFEEAARLGADWIELDVHLSRDGVPVVIHDDTLERTTTGRGLVSRATARHLARLDAGSWFDPAYADERVPTLEAALDWARSRGIGVEIELKNGPVFHEGIEAAVAGALARTGMAADALVISFDHAAVARTRALAPRALGGVLYAGKPIDEVAMARKARAGVLLPHWSFVTAEGVARAHGAGLAVTPWTTSDPKVARRLLAAGVDAITTDHPDVVARLARSARHG